MSQFRLIYTNDDGSVSIIVPAPGVSIEEAAKAVPAGKQYTIAKDTDIPADRTFRDARRPCNVKKIRTDVTKAKNISHEIRRKKREEEFKPFDEIIAKQIPGKSQQEAEAERVKIRNKYDQLQARIDSATTEEQLKQILSEI